MTEPANRRPHLQLISKEDDLDDVLLDDADVEAALAREDELRKQPPPRAAKRRQFVRFDETWRAQLLAADPPVSAAVWRLALVILAEADFHRQIKITATIMMAAGLTRFNKRAALEDLERLGLLRIEWRGSGRVPIAIPQHLGGRPGRR